MRPSADLIITNARAFTADPDRPLAEAVAMQGHRLLRVGSNDEILACSSAHTRRIDGQQKTLMPGFIDSHFHLLWGSLELGDIQLREVTTGPELTDAVRAFAQEQPELPWLVGQSLSYAVLPPNLPPRRVLDAIIADRPLIIFAYDGHTAWANTAALERAGILEDARPVGPNSEIVCSVDGLASGELREAGAFNLVTDLIPPPDQARQRELLKLGLAQAAALGVTSVHNMNGDAQELAFYHELEAAGELTLRIHCPFHVKPSMDLAALQEAVAMHEACRGDKVRSHGVKFFMDGVVENYTALLLSDYADRPGQRGGALFEVEQFLTLAGQVDRWGMQMAVHCIGDGAVRRTLDAFATLQERHGRRDSRHRIEHIELLHPDDGPRFAQLGVIASFQPAHAPSGPDDPDPWRQRVPPSRWGDAFAWQTLREAGARLVFGSDWPVATPDPLVGLRAALTRQAWVEGWPDQRQTLTEALLAYTREAAYAEFQEQQKGQLKPGYLADLVLLSRDLFTTPPAEIGQVYPLLTICDGQIVHGDSI